MVDEASIRLYPVVGWETATLPGAAVMLVMRYLPGEPSMPLTTEQMHVLSEALRFGMTADQCDELARVLQSAADKSRQRQSAER